MCGQEKATGRKLEIGIFSSIEGFNLYWKERRSEVEISKSHYSRPRYDTVNTEWGGENEIGF